MTLQPHNADAERCLLGSIMLDNRCLPLVRSVVSATDFYLEAHGHVYAACLRLDDAREPCDAATVGDALERAGKLAEVGGGLGLLAILNSVPHSEHARHYAKIVHEKSVLRQVINGCTDAIRLCQDEHAETEETIGKVSSLIQRIEEGANRRDPVTLLQAMQAELVAVGDRAKTPRSKGFSTGLPSLSALVQKFYRQQVVVIAGRPGMGKSAIAQQFCESIAGETGETVIMFCLEQSREEVALRALAGRSGIDSNRIREGRLSADEAAELWDIESREPDSPLVLDDDPDRTVASIDAAIRAAKRRGPVAAFCVDYLQLVEPADKRAPREQQVAAMTRGFKKIAKREDILCLLPTQLNREVDKRTDKRPKLSDLRESGAIEQDADVVLFPHRPDMYDADDKSGVAEIVVGKQRNGPIGVAELRYDKQRVRFVDPDLFVPADDVFGDVPRKVDPLDEFVTR